MSEFFERISQMSFKRLALLATDLQADLERLQQQQSEPLAIIGLGCRLPGGANDPASFWKLLAEGRDAVSEVPADRWDIDALYDPDPDAPGRMCTRWGGFLSAVDQFDPDFFGISPKEAAGMDPQQRLLLETAWEALEHAGQSPDRLAGSRTGVFVGLCNSDHFTVRLAGGAASFDPYVATGGAHSVAAGRISYLLGLHGPSVAVDTACSSSLVAVHLACQSLRSGECRLAIAGGVNLILAPEVTIILSKSRMMSPVGRCQAFDHSADGFVRAEGCGVILLKRLRDARADGDRILAVIRGTAANQDGKSSGLTAPNGPAQETVIRGALADARLQPADVDWVEAHGTGTALGDPIEARALAGVFGPNRPKDRPLRVGSVKTNIGHAESAAGIAGLLKVVLSLQQGAIPPNLHFRQLNPHIDWSGLPLTVPTTLEDWHPGARPRVAGVSSFGFSGTNVHIILGDPAEPAPAGATGSPPPAARYRAARVLPLSARSEPALTALLAGFETRLASLPESDWPAVCRTAGVGRSHYECRAVVVADSVGEAQARLATARQGESRRGLQRGRVPASGPPPLVFMFTGQGSQFPGMGSQFYELHSVFRKELDRCAEVLDPLLTRPLKTVLFEKGPASLDAKGLPLLHDTAFTQPALFALEWALAALWRSWGAEPAAVLGHSVGEYVAACVAGVFSLEDGLRLIAERARLMASLPAGGAMAAVLASEAVVSDALARFGQGVVIACANSPANTVISGPREAVQAVCLRLAQDSVRSQELAVSHAFHSPLMDPVLDAFELTASRVRFAEPRLPLVANRTGSFATPGLLTTPGYWRDHLRHAVRFADSVQTLAGWRKAAFLEVGPHPVLTGMARTVITDAGVLWTCSMARDKDETQTVCDALGALYLGGVAVDWAGVNRDVRSAPVDIPTYPFQRRRCWIDVPAPGARAPSRPAAARASGHPLLGGRIESAAFTGSLFPLNLGEGRPAFLNDHRIFGRVIMPSPAYVETAMAGAAMVLAGRSPDHTLGEVINLAIQEPCILPDTGPSDVQLILEPESAESCRFRFCGRETGPESAPVSETAWHTYATGLVRMSATPATPPGEPLNLAEIRARCTEERDATAFYESLVELGLEFGDRFRGIVGIRRRDGEALGEIRLPEALRAESGPYRIHPALLDACFHLLGCALPKEAPSNAFLLIGLERFSLFARPPERFWNHTTLRPAPGAQWETFSGDIRLIDDDGRLIALIQGLQLKRARGGPANAGLIADPDQWFYQLAWRDMAPPGAHTTTAPAASFLPTPAALATDVAALLHSKAQTEDLSVYDGAIPELERLCARFIHQALHRLGWTTALAGPFAAEAMAQRLGVGSAHRRLFERLLAILAEDGVLRREGDSYVQLRHLEPGDPALKANCEALGRHYPACATEIALTQRCAERLDEVLRGACDPLQLLFPGGDFSQADALYRRSPFARAMNAGIAKALQAAAGAAPPGRPLRVLEIGAGTGGTTSFVLPALEGTALDYLFTDVSPLFLDKALREFGARAGIQYRLLDIETSPSAQGLGGQVYDVVLAANVLHATRNLRETVEHAASLLAPGGLFVLLEGTERRRWVDLTFGLTEGWWRFADPELRPDYALLPGDRWMSLLQGCGLDATRLMASDDPQSAVAQQSLFIARKRPAQQPPGTWILFEDQGGLASRLTELLTARGDAVLRVATGADYCPPKAGRAVVRASAPGDLARLFLEAGASASLPVRGVLPLCLLNETAAADAALENWSPAQARIASALLGIVQACLKSASLTGLGSSRLWLVSRGAQQTEVDVAASRPADPLQAMLWGVGRVLSLEHPGSFGALVDLDPAASVDASASDLLGILTETTTEDAVAIRGGQTLAPRVVPLQSMPSAQALRLKAEGSYLITGGLGGLGLRLAEWLARNGAGRVALLSRRSLPDRASWPTLPSTDPHAQTVHSLMALEKTGVRVTVHRADVADGAALQRAMAEVEASGPPLRGVFHAAVEMTGASLADMETETYCNMARAKAAGAWNLHALTRTRDLDFLVFFSSTTAVWGAAGLGHYAAANQVLDALAGWPHPSGPRTWSINWGTWAEMRVASAAEKERFLQAGLLPMDADRALREMGRLIESGVHRAIVASVDWAALRALYEARRPRPLFAELRPKQRSPVTRAAADKAAPGAAPALSALRRCAPGRRREVLLGHLRAEAGQILGFDPAVEMDPDRGLFDMGMDSLMSVDLRGKLERSLGVTLPATLTFNYPTLNALAGYLLDEALAPELGVVAKDVPARQEPPAPIIEAPAPPATADEDLSEAELEAMLLKKLGGQS